MRQAASREDPATVRFGPPVPEPGLPPLPELVDACAAGARRAGPEPPGGGAVLREAARGYWGRRGLETGVDDVIAAPGAQPLLFALLAAYDGDVLMPRPCPASWTAQAQLLRRPAYHVPAPVDAGGVPDPFALLETVRRVRAEGGAPRVLLLCPADDPTGTVAPPELVHEVCEAARGAGLHIISDETWRDTVHRPHETVLLGPAQMWPGEVTVVCDLAGGLLPAGWPAAVARCPAASAGSASRARTLDVLAALGSLVAGPVAPAATLALDEPEPVTARLRAAAALHARVSAAAHDAVLASGAVARPPQAGRHLYADLGPLRARLADLGVTDSVELESHLTTRLGTLVPGGHRFGDDPDELCVRLSTGPLLGSTAEECLESLAAADPLELPHVAGALGRLADVFGELS
ncbi:aminotransferase class I/II-fold pyridoxal phosphate-dependent enzyme [Streptomyces hebeiensis]|uniref:Aminotransferase class I/II-fold pyridoxal phosphate-dependent enzyme n=1 Tax=Streptomyces hebeiensis TaxID=229486 RepID=A0ABN1V437_9ACTN